MGRRLMSLLLALPMLCEAQVYKCVDERGVAQYTDKPRPGCKPAAIRASPPISGKLNERREDFATQDAEFKRRQIKEAEQGAQQRQALEQRCAQLRQEHGLLASGVRISRTNTNGERVYLDDATRDQRLASVREALRSCP